MMCILLLQCGPLKRIFTSSQDAMPKRGGSPQQQTTGGFMAKLMRYEDGSYLREATADELAASLAAAETDGGVGASACAW